MELLLAVPLASAKFRLGAFLIEEFHRILLPPKRDQELADPFSAHNFFIELNINRQ
jgi:hypothetical protein